MAAAAAAAATAARSFGTVSSGCSTLSFSSLSSLLFCTQAEQTEEGGGETGLHGLQSFFRSVLFSFAACLGAEEAEADNGAMMMKSVPWEWYSARTGRAIYVCVCTCKCVCVLS